MTEGNEMLGPTGKQVQANVRLIREERGMTKKQLADRTRDLGRPIPPLGVSRIEAGTRRVDADDLAVLAMALRVSPARLLLPSPICGDDVSEVTGAGAVPAVAAWRWADGQRPLPGVGQDTDDDAARFRLDCRPAWCRR